MPDITIDQVAAAVERRSRAFALDATLAGLRHAIDRLHEEADAVALTIHLPGGDKLTAGVPSGALIRLLSQQEEALANPPSDLAAMLDTAGAEDLVPSATPAAARAEHRHVVLFGAAPVTTVGPFPSEADAVAYGRDWQARNGDNPCWQTLHVPSASDLFRFRAASDAP
jgi:hypothetical protein